MSISIRSIPEFNDSPWWHTTATNMYPVLSTFNCRKLINTTELIKHYSYKFNTIFRLNYGIVMAVLWIIDHWRKRWKDEISASVNPHCSFVQGLLKYNVMVLHLLFYYRILMNYYFFISRHSRIDSSPHSLPSIYQYSLELPLWDDGELKLTCWFSSLIL